MQTIEAAFGRNLRDFAGASRAGATIDCAGGVAAYLGAESPLSTVKGAVRGLVEADIDEVEDFFRRCESDRAMFELAPWVSSEELRRRGYEPAGEEDVVVRRPPFDTPDPTLDVRNVTPDEWPALQLFANGAEDTSAWRDIVTVCAALPGAMQFGVCEDGAWIACAEVMPAEEVAIFGNDATHPPARGRGA